MLIYILLNSLVLISGHNFISNNSNNFIVQRSSNSINETLVLEFIRSLHEHYEYRNLVFMVSSNVTVNDNFWIKLPVVPRLVITNLQFALRLHVDVPIICIIFTTGFQDVIMELASIDMGNLHLMMTLFVLDPLVESDKFHDVLNDMVEWIWQKYYVNVAIITAYNNVYKLNTYPKLTIVNKTFNWMPEDFGSNSRPNFKGYAIETPICYDLPRVFLTSKGDLSGSSGKLFNEFLNYVNATLKDIGTCSSNKQPSDIPTTLQMISEDSIDISINSFTQMKYMTEGNSYPTAIDDYCVMVPRYFQPLQHLYLKAIFDKSIYLLLGFSTVYIAIVVWLCTPVNQRDLGLCFLQAISTLLSLAPLNRFNVNNLRMRIVLILISILGFSLVNVYVTKLTSILATLLTNNPINTVEDAIAANLQILVVAYEYPTIEDHDFPKEFLNLITQVNRSVIDKHREDLNTTYGYFVQSDRWEFLERQQQYLTKPLFSMSDICIGPYFHVFALSSDSHLTEPLKDFILLSSQMGLPTYWNHKSFRDALHMDYVKIISEEGALMPLSIEFFHPILMIWSIGLTVSLIIFLYEIKQHLYRILCLESIIRRF